MKTLKRMTVALFALLSLATGIASADTEIALADTEHGYTRIFIFGASFMDPGNHFAVTGETAHPPFEPINFASYGVGGHRPTNGHTWVEVLAREMGLTDWAKPAYRDPAFGNYAFSYGRARDVIPDPVEASLYDQVSYWKTNYSCADDPLPPMNDTLFIVDTAYRDLLDVALGAPGDVVVPEMMASLAYNIGELYKCGARHLLIPNLPDLGTAPITPDGGEASGRAMSENYNGAIQLFVVGPFSGVMNISYVDFFDFFDIMMAMPETFGFTNVSDPCITPYVTKGAFCKNRNEYFWWDLLHPTKEAHALLANYAMANLPVHD